MQRYFYLGDTSSEIVELSQKESHHLHNVARVRTGECIALLNGNGTIARGKLLSVGKKCARVKIENITEIDRPKCSLTLLQATLTNANNDYIVHEATAIGVREIIFFEAQNSECKLRSKIENKLLRWGILAMEACKQSGNPFLPKISYHEALGAVNFEHFDLGIFAGLSDDARSLEKAISQHPSAKNICIAIGPEGDFSQSEYGLLRAKHLMECGLTRNILRSETAAIYSLSVLDQLLCRN
ncbi:MAG: 16S rRNA (uracil(1498)-N(3))-methyltransferase [Puniceicoccales bacterium]|jgi:16S rRNA (uracil1498-N3)-methyltransferase|nr:16S rRNA (uracil(1498)-N(3))-methyltransferase [Puniceicoccales bacterium]